MDMSEKNMELARRFFEDLLQEDPGHVSSSFLQKNNFSVRLSPLEPTILELYFILCAFTERDREGYIVSLDKEERLIIRTEKLSMDGIIDLQNDRSPFFGIVATRNLDSFCFFQEDDDYLLIAGNEEFVRLAQPVPMEISELYFKAETQRESNVSHFSILWDTYAKFMK